MYTLKCPTCGHAIASPFVRVGALTDCPQCAKRYRIEAAHVQRQPARAKRATGHALLAAEPLPAQETEDAEQTVGLSGLAQLRASPPPQVPPREIPPREAPASAQASFSRSAPPGAEASASSMPAARPPAPPAAPEARRPRRKRGFPGQPSTLLPLLGVLAVVVLLIAAVWYRAQYAATTDANFSLPITIGTALASTPWQHLSGQPPLADPPADADPPTTVVDPRFVAHADGGIAFVAAVVTQRRDVITDAELQLTLLDGRGKPLVRTTRHVALVSADHRQSVAITLPPHLHEKKLRTVTRIKVIDTEPRGVFLDDVQTWVDDRLPNTCTLHVQATNSTGQTLQRLMFLFTGRDANGRMIGQWRTAWTRPVEPHQRVEFEVALRAKSIKGIRFWSTQTLGS